MATIDTSIYSQLLRPPKSVAEYDAEAMQVQQNRLAMQINQGKLAEQQASLARTNRLAQITGSFKPGMAASEQGEILTRGGFIDEGRKVIESGARVSKEQREAEKAQREAEKEQFALARDQIGFVNQIISSAKDQASYTQGRQAMAARGMDVSQIPEKFDPAYVASAGAQTLTQLQRIDDAWKAKKFDLDERQFGETVRSNKAADADRDASRAVTVRGQNMTDARARQSLNAGKVPAGYRANADGSLTFIPGGPADPAIAEGRKPATEFQGKSAIFGARAEEADKIIGSLSGKYSPSAINSKNAVERTWGIGGVLGAATNAMALTPEDQRAEQAQRDFINAVLRQESGAAIADSEFDNARRQYFPQPGDSPEVIAQKSRNRKLSVQGLRGNAGKAAFSAPEQDPVSKAAPPSKIPQGWTVTKVN